MIDGNPMHIHPKREDSVKGDARIASIAAASIVAKVTRDALMVMRSILAIIWQNAKDMLPLNISRLLARWDFHLYIELHFVETLLRRKDYFNTPNLRNQIDLQIVIQARSFQEDRTGFFYIHETLTSNFFTFVRIITALGQTVAELVSAF